MVSYDHTQRGTLYLVLLLAGATFLNFAIVFRQWLVAICGVGLVLVGGGTAHLRVQDDGDALRVRFGPLSHVGWRIPYGDMASVEVTRTRWYHWCGIPGWPGDWRVIGLRGFDAVELRLKEPTGLLRFRRYLIGTDEPEALAEFVAGRIDHDGTTSTT